MQQKKRFLLLLLAITIAFASNGQFDNEKYGANFIFVNKGNSNKTGDISFEKYDFRISFPKSLRKPGSTIFQKFNYSKININYDIQPNFDAELENFHSIAYTLGYSTLLYKGWYFIAFLSPNVSSNFESSINFDEIRLSGMALFTKPINKNKKLMLSLGALYSSTIGIPAPIPIASLMWKPNPKWTLNIGFPRFNIQYQATQNTELGVNLFVAGENFTLTNNIPVNTANSKIDNISIMNIGGGLYLNQNLTKKLRFTFNSGYTFYRDFKFQNGNNEVIDIDLGNNVFINTGISIGL